MDQITKDEDLEKENQKLRSMLTQRDLILEGKDSMAKWYENQHVYTWDDLKWLVKTQLKECLDLQIYRHMEDEEQEDYTLGRQSALHLILQNIYRIERMYDRTKSKKADNDTGPV